MEYVKENGKHVYLADCKWVDPANQAVVDVKVGMLASDLQMYGRRGLATAIAQFYLLVGSGLILARHIFKGLDRKLFCDGNANADEEKLIYTRKPSTDYVWDGGKHGGPIRKECPPGQVLAVIISPNTRHCADYPSVKGWIDRWNWIDEDRVLPEAPKNWLDRYDLKLWTRK